MALIEALSKSLNHDLLTRLPPYPVKEDKMGLSEILVIILIATILLTSVFSIKKSLQINKEIKTKISRAANELMYAPNRVYNALLRQSVKDVSIYIDPVSKARYFVIQERHAVKFLNSALEQITSLEVAEVLAGCDRIRVLGDQSHIDYLEEVQKKWDDARVRKHIEITCLELERITE